MEERGSDICSKKLFKHFLKNFKACKSVEKVYCKSFHEIYLQTHIKY